VNQPAEHPSTGPRGHVRIMHVDGTDLTVRPILASDAGGLNRMFRTPLPQEIYLRFFSPISQIPPATLAAPDGRRPSPARRPRRARRQRDRGPSPATDAVPFRRDRRRNPERAMRRSPSRFVDACSGADSAPPARAPRDHGAPARATTRSSPDPSREPRPTRTGPQVRSRRGRVLLRRRVRSPHPLLGAPRSCHDAYLRAAQGTRFLRPRSSSTQKQQCRPSVGRRVHMERSDSLQWQLSKRARSHVRSAHVNTFEPHAASSADTMSDRGSRPDGTRRGRYRVAVRAGRTATSDWRAAPHCGRTG